MDMGTDLSVGTDNRTIKKKKKEEDAKEILDFFG